MAPNESVTGALNRVHVIGGKNHGKTTLIVELVRALSQRGLRVGTVKHTHHHHELDTPGKDSHRHREAGATTVGICSPAMNAVFWSTAQQERKTGDATDEGDKYALFEPWFQQCDLVLVEGDSQANATKLEVWRAALGSAPLAAEDRSILAVITDDQLSQDVAPVWPRSDLDAIVAALLSRLGRP